MPWAHRDCGEHTEMTPEVERAMKIQGTEVRGPQQEWCTGQGRSWGSGMRSIAEWTQKQVLVMGTHRG